MTTYFLINEFVKLWLGCILFSFLKEPTAIFPIHVRLFSVTNGVSKACVVASVEAALGYIGVDGIRSFRDLW